MKTIYIALIPLFFLNLAIAHPPHLPFDSYHSIAVDADIEHGTIIVSSSSPRNIEARIRAQLKYTVGQLNGIAGVADLNRIEISIHDIKQINQRQFLATYSARLFVAWPRERDIPQNFNFILPQSTDYQELQNFYNQYGRSECLSPQTHDLSISIFWYYYRPNNYLCPLNTDPNPRYATIVQAQLYESDENTFGKSPEYHKVWEDDQLIITAIFGKNEAQSNSNSDVGVRAFQQTYQQMIQYYGLPISTSVRPGQVVGVETPEIEAHFNSESGLVILHLFLVNSIRSTSNQFKLRYNELTQVSDFIAYAGHSGLGANIRALARMGEFVPGQYQIFLINGCDTFAYVDHALRDAHHRVNPNDSPYKFFDLITNAMPAFFHSNSRSVMNVVKALTERRFTYSQLLSTFDPYQKAVVIGEEDND